MTKKLLVLIKSNKMKRIFVYLIFVISGCSLSRLEYCDFLGYSKSKQKELIVHKLDSLYQGEKYKVVKTECIYGSEYQVTLRDDPPFEKMVIFNTEFEIVEIVMIGPELY